MRSVASWAQWTNTAGTMPSTIVTPPVIASTIQVPASTRRSLARSTISPSGVGDATASATRRYTNAAMTVATAPITTST